MASRPLNAQTSLEFEIPLWGFEVVVAIVGSISEVFFPLGWKLWPGGKHGKTCSNSLCMHGEGRGGRETDKHKMSEKERARAVYLMVYLSL